LIFDVLSLSRLRPTPDARRPTPDAYRPPPMRRFTLYFLPAVAVAGSVFGLFYGWVGVQSLVRGETGVGIFLLVFGFGGIALGVALWSVWRRLVQQARGNASS
jgi:hypothetical protein